VPSSPQAQTLRPQIGLTPAQVADVQSLLAGQGLYSGPIDGVMNGATRSGIRAFQLTARLPSTGQLDAATAGALGVASPTQAAAIFGTPFPLSGVGQNPESLFIQP
jgi:peptidoglycan hydrolase-like protein with peptidoglycan-binding domain